jgi:hypothetical protein
VEINLGYQLCLLGGFLGLTLLVVAYLEQYIWVVLLAALLIVAATLLVLERRHKP